MREFDTDAAIDFVREVLKQDVSVNEGIERLIAYCRKEQPRVRLWDKIAVVDFAADADRVLESLRQTLTRKQLPPRITGFYFGLDGLNMPRGKGIEFGCSEAYTPGDRSLKWVYKSGHHRGEIDSVALSMLYGFGVEPASLADFVVCLGYLGLALRHAFRTLDRSLTLGAAGERAIAFGFHDGDLEFLGTIGPDGLHLVLEGPPAPTEPAPDWVLRAQRARPD